MGNDFAPKVTNMRITEAFARYERTMLKHPHQYLINSHVADDCVSINLPLFRDLVGTPSQDYVQLFKHPFQVLNELFPFPRIKSHRVSKPNQYCTFIFKEGEMISMASHRQSKLSTLFASDRALCTIQPDSPKIKKKVAAYMVTRTELIPRLAEYYNGKTSGKGQLFIERNETSEHVTDYLRAVLWTFVSITCGVTKTHCHRNTFKGTAWILSITIREDPFLHMVLRNF